MSQVLRTVSAKLSTLHKRDVAWLTKRLPKEVSKELAVYSKEFSHLVKGEGREFITMIDTQFQTSYQEALTKKTRFDTLCSSLSKLNNGEAKELNQRLPMSVRNELKNRYTWPWVEGSDDSPSSGTSIYVQEKLFQMLVSGNSKPE
ncbi:hypothetical protein [Photobacterium kasasachensis]|uniref:hypothetical protein n=1 Tax=Photobacterium kasasachensis TaxID=2910240 RepID=UPI003D09F1CB